jgi:transposase, IS5 family
MRKIDIFYQNRLKYLGDEMIKYTSTKQLAIEEFRTPFYFGLDKNNRWAKLAAIIPWDDLARIYYEALCEDIGRPALDARIVVGAMIIKEKKRLPDEETTEEIRENPYLQYFLGYEEFSHKAPFDPSLFVTLRERLGVEAFEKMTRAFIERVEAVEKPKTSKVDKKDQDPQVKDEDRREGKLILDATVAPQDIRFPTDLDLLNEAREHSEKIIDTLWKPGTGKKKPLTYRRKARADYLNLARKKKKNAKEIRKAVRKQLGYLKRNIKTIKVLLKPRMGKPVALSTKDLRLFWILQEVYRQQKEMYDNHEHQVSDRIVHVSQPHVRPIVRGKSGRDVEFGSKLSVSCVNGYAFLDYLSWDAYNESTHLKDQVEKYKDRFGFYPETVIADKIYGTHDNREYLKNHTIQFSGKALGRPPILTKTEIRIERRKRKEEQGIRNRVEGKFGEGKRRYSLDCVKAKTQRTSESWIATVFFVMNLAAWLRKDLFLSLFRLLEIVKERWLNRSKLVFLCQS